MSSRMKTIGFVGILAFFACSQGQVPVTQLKTEGKASVAVRKQPTWPNIPPKRNQLKAAQAIAQVRASFLKIRTDEEAFTTAAKWIKNHHSSAVETCTSIEALYHLQLKVGPTKVSTAEVIRVWRDHLRLSDPTILENARQAVLFKSSWVLFGMSYQVNKAIFDVYHDDPAMAAFWKPLWAYLNPSDKKGIRALSNTLELRAKQEPGIILDGIGNADSSIGTMKVGASYGWSLLINSSNYPLAKSECIRLLKEAQDIKGKSKEFIAYLDGYERLLKAQGIL